MRIKVLTYNIHKCTGGIDRRCAPDRIAAVAGHYQPDIVLLQEVAQQGSWYRHERQVDVLGDALGLRHRAYFVNVRFGPRRGEYGNAILSRHPIMSTENVDLTIGGKKARSVLHARLRLALPGHHFRTLHVFNMHLGLSQRERLLQLQRFLACEPFHGLHPRTPILVAGDFNDVWGTLGRTTLEPAGFRAMPNPLRTFPAWGPVRALDSMYVRGDLHMVDVRTPRLALARLASDHLPLVADVRIASGPAAQLASGSTH